MTKTQVTGDRAIVGRRIVTVVFLFQITGYFPTTVAGTLYRLDFRVPSWLHDPFLHPYRDEA